MEFLNPDNAMKYAKAAAEELKDSPLRAALNTAVTKSARLVQRIDRVDAYYYIVTLHVGARDTARVIVDAFDGKTREIGGVTESHASLPPFIAESDAMGKLFSESRITPKWEINLRTGLVGLHPVLVWRPCRESASPLMPFYQFSVGNAFVYLRVDGRLCATLTTGPA